MNRENGYVETAEGVYGNSYTQTSVKVGTNSGVAASGAPGFNISRFSGLTPTNCKINIDFAVGRTNTAGKMKLAIPLFASRNSAATEMGGTAVELSDSDTIVFYGTDTGIAMPSDSWQKFAISIDTSTGIAYLYYGGKQISSKQIGRAKGIDSIDFCFPNTAAGAWYIDSINVNTSDSFPTFEPEENGNLYSLYFNGLETNTLYPKDGLSYVNFSSPANEVFRMEAAQGVFGKTADDVCLAVKNTDSAVNLSGFSSGSADERYHALKLDLPNANAAKGSVYVLDMQIAADTLLSSKRVKSEAYFKNSSGCELADVISIDTRGYVTTFGTYLKYDNENIIVQPGKWYSTRVIITPSDGTVSNKVSVYWDGKLALDNADFLVDGKRTNVFGGFSSLEAGYSIAHSPITDSDKLSDGNYSRYNADGMYLDNIVYSVYDSKNLPVQTESYIRSNSLYYANTIDMAKNIVYSYGQDSEKFLSKLRVDGMKAAYLVDEHGNILSDSEIDSARYLRIDFDDRVPVYAKIENGTDEYMSSVDINSENDINRDLSTFYVYSQPDISKLKGTVLDASFVLDAPAGKHGTVQRSGDSFVCVDESGNETPIKFYGTNIGGKGAFPETHEEADMIADSIAAAGFNLVRVHNIDGVSVPNIFGNANSGKRLSDEQMDKLCYLLSAFKERGIYYFLDQTVGRKIYADDGVEDYDTVKSTRAVCYFDETLTNILENYSEMFLGYYNKYTGCKIGEDSALALIDFNNENDLLSFDIRSLVGTNYYDDYKRLYNEWLIERYGTRDKLKEAWNKPDWYMTRSLEDSEDPAEGTVELTSGGSIGSGDDTKFYTPARSQDELRFAGEVMQRYFARRIAHLREFGVKCAITGNTAFGDVMPEMWYANSTTDFVDTHLYWSHRADGEDLLTPGIRFNTNNMEKDAVTGEVIKGTTSSLRADGLGLIGQAATRRVYGSPYTISEIKHCPANPYIAESLPLISAYSAMHGWNPIDFVFNTNTNYYTKLQNGEKVRLTGVFSSQENPILRAMYPASAITFLRSDVSEATSGYYVNYTDRADNRDETDLYYVGKTKDGSSRIWPGRHLFEKTGNYGLIGKTGVAFSSDGMGSVNDISVKEAADAATNGGKVYNSQTGELTTDLSNGIFSMNTACSQAICGFIGGMRHTAGALSTNIDNSYAAVTLVSLDSNAIESSDSMLLTMAGNAINYGQLLSEDGNTLKKAGVYPIMTEQITGEIEIAVSGDFDVYSLTSSGERKEKVAVTHTVNGFKFTVGRNAEAMNFEIVKR